MRTPTSRDRHAFSLIELSISTVIVGVMMTASLTVVADGLASRATLRRGAAAQAMAEQLLAEITSQAYADAGGSTTLGLEAAVGTRSRVTFDDVDDYALLVENPPAERDGTPVAGASAFVRSTEVVWVTAANLRTGSITDTGVKRIAVTVRHSGKVVASASAVRTRLYDGVAP